MNTSPSLSTAAASSSVSLALVVILEWLLGYVHIVMPADVQTAVATVLTSAIHYAMINPDVLKKTIGPEIPP